MLAQLEDGPFLTDGGLETVLIFHEGMELPAFAAFPLLAHEAGLRALRRYYQPYLELARERGLGFVLESPTWRASPHWGDELGYSRDELDALNRRAIALMDELGVRLTARQAQDYHATQIATFAGTPADMVTALTLTYADEAIGIARAAAEAEIPAVISFTTETDGRLPSGQSLGDAIEQVDGETGGAPAYYMVNCAHPTHFAGALTDGPWRERIRGLRANASTRSHAELDESDALDDGDPADLGARYAALAARLPRLSVLGGCCGTDDRHVRAIRDAWLSRRGCPSSG